MLKVQHPAMPPSSPPALQLDLAGLPPLITPAPPSNTLLITNLTNPALFEPAALRTLQSYLEAAGQAPVHSFSPLRALRRVIVSFETTDAAVRVRQALDRTPLLGCVTRVYFGQPTPLNAAPSLLQAPRADKQFFISPPPSPPHGWTMRNEEPPNREVHAEDLAAALQGLEARNHEFDREDDGDARMAEAGEEEEDESMADATRPRGTTLVYNPAAHGAHANLPAVMVEDTTAEGVKLDGDARIREHTARPPVELME